jgi:hypothetical protein
VTGKWTGYPSGERCGVRTWRQDECFGVWLLFLWWVGVGLFGGRLGFYGSALCEIVDRKLLFLFIGGGGWEVNSCCGGRMCDV